MSPHRPLPELMALIEHALADLPAEGLTQAANGAEHADTLLGETLDGTHNDSAYEAISASAEGQRRLEAARVLLEVARAELTAYLYDIVGSSASPSSISADGPVSPGPMPRWDYTPGVRQKTHGRHIDRDGNVHVLMSGQHDDAFRAANKKACDLGLIKPEGNRIFSAAADVEIKFAVSMSRNQRAVIVISNPTGPCKGDYGCRKQLPAFLPDGAELTVYWPGGRQTFHGGNVKT